MEFDFGGNVWLSRTGVILGGFQHFEDCHEYGFVVIIRSQGLMHDFSSLNNIKVFVIVS